MTQALQLDVPVLTKPLLLFDGECAVCRYIARWVGVWAAKTSGEPSIVEQPIGDDPEALRALNANLDIWDAYATIHVLMPDGSMKRGGEAVAEVLRNISATAWLTPLFAIRILGFRPFALLLSVGYTVLADVRPLLGCESCGAPAAWLTPFAWLINIAKRESIAKDVPAPSPHFTTSKR